MLLCEAVLIWLRPRNSYTRALLVSHDRRHFFVTPWPFMMHAWPLAVTLWMLPAAPCPHCASLYHLAELYWFIFKVAGKGRYILGHIVKGTISPREKNSSKDVFGDAMWHTRTDGHDTEQKRYNDVHMCRVWTSAALTGCGQLVSTRWSKHNITLPSKKKNSSNFYT